MLKGSIPALLGLCRILACLVPKLCLQYKPDGPPSICRLQHPGAVCLNVGSSRKPRLIPVELATIAEGTQLRAPPLVAHRFVLGAGCGYVPCFQEVCCALQAARACLVNILHVVPWKLRT